MGFCLLSDPSLRHSVFLVILGMVGMGAKLTSKEREKQQRLCNKNANLCRTSFFFWQLVFWQKVINKHRTEKATKKITITKGMSSSKSTSSGGSSSPTVSGEVGFSVMKLFDVSSAHQKHWSITGVCLLLGRNVRKWLVKYPSVLSQETKYQCFRLLASVKTVMALFTL